MTEADFKRLAAEGYNRAPLALETFVDLDTPLSIYPKPDTIYPKPDTLGCPDLLLLSEEIAVLDKLTGKLHLVVFAGLPSPSPPRGIIRLPSHDRACPTALK